jgi:hypothetical protein
MSNSVITSYKTGKTVYFVVLNGSGLYWTGSGFENKNNSHWSSYVQHMTEIDFGNYTGTFPDTIGAGLYYILAFEQMGGSPSQTDKYVRSGAMDWNGSSEWSGGISEAGSVEIQFSVGVGVSNNVEMQTGVKSMGVAETQTGVNNG